MKNILFVSYGGGHINSLIPIIKKLNVRKDIRLTVLGLTTAGATLEKENIEYIGFRNLVQEEDSEAIKIGEKFNNNINNSVVVAEETIAYMGLSFFDLVQRYGEETANHMYQTKGRQAFLPLTVMERLFDKIQPDLVITTNSPRAEQAAILTARKYSIPAICLIDLFGISEMAWIGKSLYADRLCVLNEAVRQLYLGAGRKDSEISVTGNPAFDYLIDPELIKKGQIFREQKNLTNKKVILWASQQGEPGNYDLPRIIDSKLLNIVQKHPEWHLIIRYHPSENENFTYQHPQISLSTQNDDLSTLLAAVDLVVTMTSTVGLQAALIGKPLVTIDMSIYSKDVLYAEMGLSKGVSNFEDLEATIKMSFETKIAPPHFEKATDKVIKVIDELL